MSGATSRTVIWTEAVCRLCHSPWLRLEPSESTCKTILGQSGNAADRTDSTIAERVISRILTGHSLGNRARCQCGFSGLGRPFAPQGSPTHRAGLAVSAIHADADDASCRGPGADRAYETATAMSSHVIELTRDPDAHVRDWATLCPGNTGGRRHTRDSTGACLKGSTDEDCRRSWRKSFVGLARRERSERLLPALQAELASDVGRARSASKLLPLIRRSVTRIRFLMRSSGMVGRGMATTELLQEAIEACRPDSGSCHVRSP